MIYLHVIVRTTNSRIGGSCSIGEMIINCVHREVRYVRRELRTPELDLASTQEGTRRGIKESLTYWDNKNWKENSRTTDARKYNRYTFRNPLDPEKYVRAVGNKNTAPAWLTRRVLGR
jgi:hypothetical protein